MKKIVRLTESDLVRIVKRFLKESSPEGPEMPETPTPEYLDYVASLDTNKETEDQQQVAEFWNRRRINFKKYPR
jgi:hypothetical protein